MKYGVGFPVIALSDVGAVRDFGQTYDGAGFDYITAAGHMLSAPAGRYEDVPAARYVGPYHDPFALFSYLAGITSHVHFITSILILPLYETAIVAKQSAELDFLSQGRFELGVGISWQEAEYRALGQNLSQRGARLAEQVQVLRLFWSKPFVSFKGAFHDIDNVGLNRLPPQPIPIWFGSSLDETPMRRAAALGDGWMPMMDLQEPMPRFVNYMADAGRKPSSMRFMGQIVAGNGGADAWIAEGKRLQAAGATHITINVSPKLPAGEATKRLIDAKNTLSQALA